MENWRRVWRQGIVPQLSTQGLVALQVALEADDPRLLQNITIHPAALQCHAGCPVEAACPIGTALWQGDGRDTVEDLASGFAMLCNECDRITGEFGSAGSFLNFWDSAPRADAIRQLLVEVTINVADRFINEAVACSECGQPLTAA